MIEMAKAAKSRHGESELVNVASRQTLKKGRIRDFLPRAGETVFRPATKSRPWNISWTTRTKRASLNPNFLLQNRNLCGTQVLIFDHR